MPQEPSSPSPPQLPSRSARAALMVPRSATILKRLYFLQRELVLMQAGWLADVRHWQSKLLLPEFLWQDMLICHELRQRVLEMRYPQREIDLPPDEALLSLWRKLGDAPTGEAFCQGLWRAAKPKIRQACQGYLDLTDHLDDGPTVRILRQAVEDIDGQLHRWKEASQDLSTAFRPELPIIDGWVGGLDHWGIAVGDLLDPQQPSSTFDTAEYAGKPLSISRAGQRDPRFRLLKFAWPDMIDGSFGAGEGIRLQVRQAVHHLNEVWAAEMAAACLWDLGQGPGEDTHEFLLDAARWCYDEIRHCRMGFTRLSDWGFTMGEMPLAGWSYDAGADADPLTRLGIIFYFESTYIHTKWQRTKIFGDAGDRVSSHDMDFDWADEQIHAHYGARWLKHFLEKAGDPRKPIEFRAQAEACVQHMQQSATPADRQATMAAFDAAMARAEQLAKPQGGDDWVTR